MLNFLSNVGAHAIEALSHLALGIAPVPLQQPSHNVEITELNG